MASNFEKQSVGWNPTPPPASNQRQFSPNEGNKKKDNSCFFCKKEGHWVKDCPMKSPNQGPPTPPPSTGDLHCRCGIHLAPQLSKANRLYYACPLRSVSINALAPVFTLPFVIVSFYYFYFYSNLCKSASFEDRPKSLRKFEYKPPLMAWF